MGNRVSSSSIILILGVFWGIWALAGGQPQFDREGRMVPPPPSREDTDFWESVSGKPLTQDDPLVIWRDALKKYLEHSRQLERLLREQNVLSEQLRNEMSGLKPGRPSLPEIPRLKEKRRLVASLHENALAIEREEKEIHNTAKPVVEKAAEIAQRLGEIRTQMENRAADYSGQGPSGRKRFWEKQKDRIDSLERVLEEVQADPEHGVEKVVDAFRMSAMMMERRGGPGVMIQQMREQMESLEREQAFLKQRLENHEEALRMLRAQMDFLAGPPRPATGDASTTGSMQSSPLLLPEKSAE